MYLPEASDLSALLIGAPKKSLLKHENFMLISSVIFSRSYIHTWINKPLSYLFNFFILGSYLVLCLFIHILFYLYIVKYIERYVILYVLGNLDVSIPNVRSKSGKCSLYPSVYSIYDDIWCKMV
jgi:hypothetical protein